ncbi:MAG TPA: deoxyribose-phosphate aldolase [Bryobacteraceae bacterium]|nr:deoxyribose-phosphate aldolase [Bryobacteraceae bacterium]
MSFDRKIAGLIDHTILRPDATRADVRRVCEEALKYGFASVCVNSFWVPQVARELGGSSVKVCTVAGFPLGAVSTAAKVAEALGAIREGASEIDMVLNIGALLADERAVAQSDILAVVRVSHDNGALVKVIIETALLNDEQKRLACQLSADAGADFVKTSTGFAKLGATAADIALMRAAVGPVIGVKASGGIRTLEDLRRMVAAGATRVGASASVAIIEATRPESENAAAS